MKFKNYYKEDDNINNLPPGFTSDMVGDLKDLFPKKESSSELEEDIVDDEIDKEDIQDVDVAELRDRKLHPEKYKQLKAAERPEKFLHKSLLIDENGNPIDDELLKKQLSVRPKSLISQNSKLKKAGGNMMIYDMTLPAYRGLFLDETSNSLKSILICKGSSSTCRSFCYASRGGFIMFPTSSLNVARTMTFLMNDYNGFKQQVISELKSLVNKNKVNGTKVVLRLTDSGDILNSSYLLMVFDWAKTYPQVLFYTYTKMIPLIKKYQEIKPDNVVFNFSFGGKWDEQIDVKKDKHAVVVPATLFKDLEIEEETPEYRIYTDESIKILKQRIAKEYNLDPKTVITYDEMIQKPVGKVPKWNVIVYKGSSDINATRQDVLGSYLLFH